MVVVGQGKRQLDRVVEWKPKAFLIILFISLLFIIIIIVIVDIELVFFVLLLNPLLPPGGRLRRCRGTTAVHGLELLHHHQGVHSRRNGAWDLLPTRGSRLRLELHPPL